MTRMKCEIIDSTILLVASFAGTAVTQNEVSAVFLYAVIGSVIGSPIGMILSDVFTAPGLERVGQAKRLAANWLSGMAGGTFSAWWIREHILGEQYPIELCASFGGFFFAILGVVAACLLWPLARRKITDFGVKHDAPTTKITSNPTSRKIEERDKW